MYTLRDYKNSLSALKSINDEEDKAIEVFEEEKKAISNKYWDIKRELEEKISISEREKDSKIEVVNSKISSYQKKMTDKRSSHKEVKDHVERLFKFYQVSLDPPELKPVEPLIVLADDPYKKIYIRIKNNRKPKNCFSLTLSIDSIFSYAFNRNISYADTNKNNKLDNTLSHEGVLKDAPSREDLQQWYEKNADTLKWNVWRRGPITLKEFLSEHAVLEKDYEEAKILFQDDTWKKAYWLDQKHYYETLVSRGTDTDSYKEILEVLKILNTPEKNLSLLLDVESIQGKKELERRLYGTHSPELNSAC